MQRSPRNPCRATNPAGGVAIAPAGSGAAPNPAALASYYIGLASIIPLLGIFTGIAAVVLGIMGLKRYHAEPWRRGRIHSYAGILLGALTSITWCVMLVFFLITWGQGRLFLRH